MSKLLIALTTFMLLAGCARETCYVDQEWGVAQKASWDRQVANPDGRNAGVNPTGLEGVNAEEVMSVYNQTFAEKTSKTNVYEFGLTKEGQ
jgi:hypothetical protein